MNRRSLSLSVPDRMSLSTLVPFPTREDNVPAWATFSFISWAVAKADMSAAANKNNVLLIFFLFGKDAAKDTN